MIFLTQRQPIRSSRKNAKKQHDCYYTLQREIIVDWIVLFHQIRLFWFLKQIEFIHCYTKDMIFGKIRILFLTELANGKLTYNWSISFSLSYPINWSTLSVHTGNWVMHKIHFVLLMELLEIIFFFFDNMILYIIRLLKQW